MKETKRDPLAIFSYFWSYVLGFLYIYLFAWKTPGISHVLFYSIALGSAIVPAFLFNKGNGAKKLTNWIILMPFVLVLSLMFIYRVNEFWVSIGFLTIPVIYAVVTVASYYENTFKNFSLLSYITLPFTLFISWFNDWAKFRKKVTGVFFKSERTRMLMKRISKGFFISLPFLFVFGWLLVSADEVFAKIIIEFLEKTLGTWFKDWPTAISTFTKFGLAIGTAIYFMVFNYALWNKESKVGELIKSWNVEVKEVKKSVDVLVASVFMIMLNLLFVTFVVVQFVYLFGGENNILGMDAEFSYAQYARKGFWELLLVAGFSYLIILFMNLKVFVANALQKGLFKINHFIMTGSVLVMTYSAFARMGLYETVYGYTNLRVLVQLALITVGLMFVFLIISSFSKTPRKFIASTNAILAFVVYITLVILPSDYFVASLNYSRYKEEGLLDVEYMMNLSDEAIPVLVELANKEKDKSAMGKVVMAELEGRYEQIEEGREDWQSWNYVDQKNKETLKELFSGGQNWTQEAEDSLDTFLNEYTSLILAGEYEQAFDGYWSSTVEKDLINNLDDISISSYYVTYIPEYSSWPMSDFGDYAYREQYYWNGMTVSVSFDYSYKDEYGFEKRQCRTDSLGVSLEDGEWRIVDASEVLLGKNIDEGYKALWEGEPLKDAEYWNECY